MQFTSLEKSEFHTCIAHSILFLVLGIFKKTNRSGPSSWFGNKKFDGRVPVSHCWVFIRSSGFCWTSGSTRKYFSMSCILLPTVSPWVFPSAVLRILKNLFRRCMAISSFVSRRKLSNFYRILSKPLHTLTRSRP
jgi:hypothetical protein